MDIFTKQFNKDYFGSGSSEGSSEEYSIYNDPNTGEQKYFPGELPLKTGLPPEIEEGTPEAMEYKKKQIEVYGFPYELISDSEIERVKKLRQETVVDDPNWARASKMLRAFMQPGADEFKTDKEYAEWGIDFMSSFENNFTNMVFDIAKLESAPPQAMHAMYYLMETADRDGLLAENFWRGAYYTVFDFANLVGLGTMGIGLIGKSAGKQLTKVAFKEAVKRIVMSKPDASDLAMIVEGGIYAGGFTAGREIQKERAGKGEVSVGNIATSTAIGGTVGPVLSKTGQVAMEGGRRVVNKVTDALTPSAESIAARNVDQVIDDTTGVLEESFNKGKETNTFTPAEVKDNRRVGTTGQYVGAPKGIDPPQKLAAMRKNLFKIAQEGEPGRFWYERSSQAILDAVNGDKEAADKIAQAIAITSGGQTPVESNFNFAIQAYNNWKQGNEIVTGRFPTAMGPRLQTVFDGGSWEGRKTNTFYNNVMVNIDPKRSQGVTVDMHMMRVFGFKTENPTTQQYEFVENEVNRIANKLGWTPYQTQAAMWVVQKANKEGKSVKDMSFDYKDALERSLGQISWETKPSATSGHLKEIFDAPMEQQAEYHFAIAKALTGDDGVDLIAKDVGLLSPGSFDAPGVFEGVVSPGTQTLALMPKKYKGKVGEVDEATLELVKMYAVARGILLKQDGVGFHRPFWNKGTPKGQLNGFDINIGRPLTNDEAIQLDKIIAEKTGMDFLSPVSTDTGFRLLNFTDGSDGQIPNADYQRMMQEVLDIFEISDIKREGGADVKLFKAQLGYVGNNWKEAPNGEIYIKDSFPGRPDIQARVQSIVSKYAERIKAVDDEFTAKYGWSQGNYNTKYTGNTGTKEGGVDTTVPPVTKEGGE